MDHHEFIEELDAIEMKKNDNVFYWSDLPITRKVIMFLILILVVSAAVFRFLYIYTDRPSVIPFYIVFLMFSYFLYGTLLIKNQQFAYTYFFVFLILFIKIMIEFFFYNAKGLINLMLLMGFAYLLSRIAIKTIKKISKPETKQLVFAVLSIVFYILTSFTNAVARVKKLQYLEIDGVERIGVYKPLAKESWKDNGWKPSSKMVFQTEDKVFIMKVIDMMKKTRPYSYDRGESIKDPNLMCFYRKKNEKGFCVRIGKGTRFSNNTVRIDTSEASAYVSFELYEEKDILFQNDFHD